MVGWGLIQQGEENGLVDLLSGKRRFQFKSAHVPAQASQSGVGVQGVVGVLSEGV